MQWLTKNLSDNFRYCKKKIKKKNLKNLDIKISKRQEKLKNQMIYYLEIIET